MSEPEAHTDPAAKIAQLHTAALELDRLCEVMHDAYEAAAAEHGWQTNPASRVAWADVPDENKRTMRIAVRALRAVDPVRLALTQIRQLHQPDGWNMCAQCRVQWPCPTASLLPEVNQ